MPRQLPQLSRRVKSTTMRNAQSSGKYICETKRLYYENISHRLWIDQHFASTVDSCHECIKNDSGFWLLDGDAMVHCR